jgi:hypothetical protein
LTFADLNGIPVTSPFLPSSLDPSATLILQGTPTVEGARQFADLKISQATVTVTATRTTPSPFVVASQDLTFAFAETVLFNSFNPFSFFANVALDPSANFVQAQTYFVSSNVPITSITALTGLPAGVSLNVVNGTAYFTGTPTTPAVGTYTLRATNANGTTRDASVSISVVTDTISLTGPQDVCYNFVISRPTSSALTGYYPAPISWSATSDAGLGVSFSAPALAGTGLTLDVSGTTATLGGVPDTNTPLGTLRIVASSTGSPATATRDVSFAVVDDVFTFSTAPAQTLIQNKAMTPVRITASTLSERLVVNWSSTGLPTGLSISSDGVISGTPLVEQASFVPATLTASTGYASASSNLSFKVLADDILIASVNGIDTIDPVFSNVDIRSISYSGVPTPVVLDTSSLIPYQGQPKISLNLTTAGMLSGNMTTANRIFPAYSIKVQATAGALTSIERLFFQMSNTPIPYHAFLAETSPSSAVLAPSYVPPLSTFNVWTTSEYAYAAQISNATAQFNTAISNFTTSSPTDSNVAYYGDLGQSPTALVLGAGSNMYRSIDGGQTWSTLTSPSTFQGPRIAIPNLPFPPTLYTFPKPLVLALTSDGTSNWVCLCAASTGDGSPITVVRTSSDDGVTWADVSLTLFTRPPPGPTLDPGASATRLFYNKGKYFLTQIGACNASVYSVASGSVTSPWTPATGVMSNGGAYGMAFSDTLALVVGGNSNENIYRSADNGTSWSQVVDARFNGSSPVISAAGYGDGQFMIAVNDFGIGNEVWTYQSTDTSNWTRYGNTTGSNYSNVGLVYDDNAWIVGSTNPGSWSISRVQPDLSDSYPLSTSIPAGYSLKRMLFQPLSRGAVTGTVQIVRPALINLAGFVEPTQTSYTFYQFCSNTPIAGSAVSASTNFIYYYASGVPDGMSATIDGSGILVTGKSVTYTDAPQRTAFFARQGTDTVTTSFTSRTILPFPVRDTVTPASAFTSLTRQYAVVNAARNAENRVVYPAETRTIGEFTRPYPPDETTQTVDPKCYSTSNCP